MEFELQGFASIDSVATSLKIESAVFIEKLRQHGFVEKSSAKVPKLTAKGLEKGFRRVGDASETDNPVYSLHMPLSLANAFKQIEGP